MFRAPDACLGLTCVVKFETRLGRASKRKLRFAGFRVPESWATTQICQHPRVGTCDRTATEMRQKCDSQLRRPRAMELPEIPVSTPNQKREVFLDSFSIREARCLNSHHLQHEKRRVCSFYCVVVNFTRTSSSGNKPAEMLLRCIFPEWEFENRRHSHELISKKIY